MVELSELDLTDCGSDVSLETKVSYIDEFSSEGNGWDTKDLAKAFVIVDSLTNEEIILDLSLFDLSQNGKFISFNS